MEPLWVVGMCLLLALIGGLYTVHVILQRYADDVRAGMVHRTEWEAAVEELRKQKKEDTW